MNEGVEKYVEMQRSTIYDTEDADVERYKEITCGIGSEAFEQIVSDRCYMMHWSYLPDLTYNKDRVALDFGCGVGRLMIGWRNYFARIDGVDLSLKMLENCKKHLLQHNITNANLYHCNGYDIRDVPSDTYDVVYSELVFEHICVHDIRHNYLKEFLRVLKQDGELSILTKAGNAYPKDSPYSSGWYDNNYDAQHTNGMCDTRIEDLLALSDELHALGYYNVYFGTHKMSPEDDNVPEHTHFLLIKAHKYGRGSTD